MSAEDPDGEESEAEEADTEEAAVEVSAGGDFSAGDSGSGGSVIPVIAGIIAVLAIAAVAVVLVLKGKKKGQPASAAPSPIPAQGYAPQRRPVVYSVSPIHGGMKISAERGPVVIGRDPASCQIAFRDGTPGVSRRHCQIAWDMARGEFVLTDLNSSYGTFLLNGQRLNPGTPFYLKPGDGFYAGDRANEIRTELS